MFKYGFSEEEIANNEFDNFIHDNDKINNKIYPIALLDSQTIKQTNPKLLYKTKSG